MGTVGVVVDGASPLVDLSERRVLPVVVGDTADPCGQVGTDSSTKSGGMKRWHQFFYFDHH